MKYLTATFHFNSIEIYYTMVLGYHKYGGKKRREKKKIKRNLLIVAAG